MDHGLARAGQQRRLHDPETGMLPVEPGVGRAGRGRAQQRGVGSGDLRGIVEGADQQGSRRGRRGKRRQGCQQQQRPGGAGHAR